MTKVTSKIRSQYRGFVIFLFHIFYHYVGKENRSLHRGLRYIEARYIKVPLYLHSHRCTASLVSQVFAYSQAMFQVLTLT